MSKVLNIFVYIWKDNQAYDLELDFLHYFSLNHLTEKAPGYIYW